ncbi:MAG: DUF3990 domain-containing protein [Eggerthellaceae bacterium]|nr:DUF3990 domain-containing protein [Eggerthellaceae bacterium]
MKKLTLYHGSPIVVEKPSLDKCRSGTDYGTGFYCTEHEELAKEWACTAVRGGFANRYRLDARNLSVLNLADVDHAMLRWLCLLVQNRSVRLSTPNMRRGKDWLIEHFSLDISAHDLVIGYRADDSYFGFVRAFLNNVITFEQLSIAMRLGKLGEQYVLKTQRAIDALEFEGAEAAERATYYPLRKARDEAAATAFNELLEKEDRGGVLLRDLLEGRVGLDDARIR